MSEEAHSITTVRLRVSIDPGHNGTFAEYTIDSDQAGYRVALRISRFVHEPARRPVPPPRPPNPSARPLPVPKDSPFRSSELTEVLAKDQSQVQAFLEQLAAEFHVYELTDQAWQYPFLHPTFYSFSFRDAAGTNHSFDYRIEASHHVDERYKRLVEAFDSFFESRRVFAAFFERQRQNP